ncbi:MULTISPECIES: hypothetical protein [Streptomyces]|uniref:Uncharacterized protein n=1 Tax=Streptomyces fradiae TaxID=1906 RepID=A0ACC4W556_STRFR|nr:MULTISPECIES: hypothetical protein [Streptomyces]KNE79645.1 hypothetical protein ADZ36_26410 [Streptomyces fradiae]OFA37740.1 hypothetical protein BEN35_28725 [Streptomyces fradiae]PQM23208.1 hypothetical protein Sfr7A_11470 [Streptomyces xinghaiensis]
MPLPEARADGIAARFSAAGFTPRVEDHDDHTCVETDIPDPVTAEAWGRLVTVLETADRFGFVSSESGRIAWAAVSKKTPGTVTDVRGHDPHPQGADQHVRLHPP